MRFATFMLLALVLGAASFGTVLASASGVISIYLGLPLEIALICAAFVAVHHAEAA